MLILLPPSEGKAAVPSRGRALDLDTLSLPALSPTRARLVEALERLAKGPRGAAVTALGLTPGLASEVDKNAVLTTAPAMAAERLYTGVLYDALDLAGLPRPARRLAGRRLLISSALFGAVRINDRIPAYRLSMSARLPRIGGLAAAWRSPLADVMPQAVGAGLILDLRSGPYAAMWRPTGDLARRTATVRVLHELVPGDRASRAIVSHFNKATKGRLVRDLLIDGGTPRTPIDLAEHLTAMGWAVEPGPGAKPGGPAPLDVIVQQV